MRKKRFLRVAVLFFVLSIGAFFYSFNKIGAFSKNKILVQALSCKECAGYEIIAGSSKIASQVQEPSDSVNIYQAYITGEPNPFTSDYTMTFDHYLVTGRVTGLQKAAGSEMIFPVITATAWKHINVYVEWSAIVVAILLLIISLRYLAKFRKANRPDVTETSLLTHSNPPVKKS